MIQIIGAYGMVPDVDLFLFHLTSFSEKNRVMIQAMNANMIYGKDHLLAAIEHASRAFEEKRQTTDSLQKEILLYASGERQIKKAIHKMGICQGESSIGLVIIQKERKKNFSNENMVASLLKLLQLKRNDKVLEGDMDTLKQFGVTDNELATVTKKDAGDIILEKVALVDVIK